MREWALRMVKLEAAAAAAAAAERFIFLYRVSISQAPETRARRRRGYTSDVYLQARSRRGGRVGTAVDALHAAAEMTKKIIF